MKLCCISDTHNQLDQVVLPEADLLVIAGDLTMRGTEKEYIKFNEDLGRVKSKYKYGALVINGNHDFLSETDFPKTQRLLTNVDHYLQDGGTTINGIKAYGSPATPFFHAWAHNYHRGKDIAAVWTKIPNDVNLLVIHGPPYGILDEVPRGVFGSENVGCQDLLNRIQGLKELKVVVFGHIHCQAHPTPLEINGVKYINAAMCSEAPYKVVNTPIIVEV
jgi:Icc-related predicted phosphoesterase